MKCIQGNITLHLICLPITFGEVLEMPTWATKAISSVFIDIAFELDGWTGGRGERGKEGCMDFIRSVTKIILSPQH